MQFLLSQKRICDEKHPRGLSDAVLDNELLEKV